MGEKERKKRWRKGREAKDIMMEREGERERERERERELKKKKNN